MHGSRVRYDLYMDGDDGEHCDNVVGVPIVGHVYPDDPDGIWYNRCPLCGLMAAEHTEEACEAKLAASPGPRGILALTNADDLEVLYDWPAAAGQSVIVVGRGDEE
jgi:hypothetical protein